MDEFAALGIDPTRTSENHEIAQGETPPRSRSLRRARLPAEPTKSPNPWISVAFALAGALTYGLLQLGLLAWTQWVIFIFILGAGPLAIVGLVFGIISAVRRVNPRWLALVGILLSLCAISYIALVFLNFLAQIAFA